MFKSLTKRYQKLNVESLDEYELLIELRINTNEAYPLLLDLTLMSTRIHMDIATGGYSTKFGMTNDQIEGLPEKAPSLI